MTEMKIPPIEVSCMGYDLDSNPAIKKLVIEIFPLNEEHMMALGLHLKECVRDYLEVTDAFGLGPGVVAIPIPLNKESGNVH